MADNTWQIDVVFGRGSEHPVTYHLPVVKAHKELYGQNPFLNISDLAPRRLGGDGWHEGHLVEDVNRGWLHHGILKTYPRVSETGFEVPPEKQVAVKWVRGTRAIESLRREATMYEGVLEPLQGSAVPIFYGLLIGMQDGVDIGCLLLEWCPGNDPLAEGKPTEDVLHMRAQAVHSLHDVGVYHGDLYERSDALCVSDGRHFLRAEDGTIRIVDFQRAIDDKTVNVEDYESFERSKLQELAYATEHSQRAYTDGYLIAISWNTF